MFWIFSNKSKINEVRKETKKGFESVKNDILSISEWIKHLNSEKINHKKEIESIKEEISTIKIEIEEIKNSFNSIQNFEINTIPKNIFKTTKHLFNKQTAVYPVQTAVQTAVQTPNLSNFSITERAIIGILMNSDMKLSYEDVAKLLGKEKSTIRGQINSIKAKSESLIQEIVEKNGKKRIFIPEDIKQKIVKKTKVRIKESDDNKNEEEK